MNRFLSILKSFEGLQVGVVGDFLLDQYVLGTTSKDLRILRKRFMAFDREY